MYFSCRHMHSCHARTCGRLKTFREVFTAKGNRDDNTIFFSKFLSFIRSENRFPLVSAFVLPAAKQPCPANCPWNVLGFSEITLKFLFFRVKVTCSKK